MTGKGQPPQQSAIAPKTLQHGKSNSSERCASKRQRVATTSTSASGGRKRIFKGERARELRICSVGLWVCGSVGLWVCGFGGFLVRVAVFGLDSGMPLGSDGAEPLGVAT